jgi:hypothetical protein
MPKINSNISYDWLQQDILFRYSRQHITKQMKLMYTTVSYGNMIDAKSNTPAVIKLHPHIHTSNAQQQP